MSDDDLRRLFEIAREDVVDAGFARRVVTKVQRRQRNRKLALGAAGVAGASIAVSPLLELMHTLALSLTPMATAATPLAGAMPLCAVAVAVWLFSLAWEG